MAVILAVEAYEGAFVNFRRDFLDALVGAGHHVVAAAPHISPAIAEELHARKIEYAEYPMSRASINPARDLRTIAKLASLVRKIRPDAVVSFGPKAVIHAGLAAHIAGGVPGLGVITGRGHASSGRGWRSLVVSTAQHFLYRSSLRRYHAVYFHNPDDHQLFWSKGYLRKVNHHGVVGGSGVDLDQFAPTPMPLDKAAFLFVGRLIITKGISEFLAAATQIKRAFPEVTIKVAGWHDEERPDALSQADFQALESSDGIEYLGRLEDIRSALSESNVLVLPSYGEGTPRSVLEALAMKRAVITTDTPGCKETVIHGESGYLVPARDATSLVEAMARYATQPELAAAHGQVGHLLAVTKYDVRIINKQLLAVLTQVLQDLRVR